jgi:hypothetical protein
VKRLHPLDSLRDHLVNQVWGADLRGVGEHRNAVGTLHDAAGLAGLELRAPYVGRLAAAQVTVEGLALRGHVAGLDHRRRDMRSADRAGAADLRAPV